MFDVSSCSRRRGCKRQAGDQPPVPYKKMKTDQGPAVDPSLSSSLPALSPDRLLLDSPCSMHPFPADFSYIEYSSSSSSGSSSSSPSFLLDPSLGSADTCDSADNTREELPTVPWSKVAMGEKIGEGKYGRVHIAQMTREDGSAVPVAVKIANKYLEREARTLRSLHGQGGVPELYGVTDTEPAAIVMGYCPGQTFASFLRQYETTAVEKNLRALVATCSALQDFHEAGYDHNDLHSDNVIVEPDSGGDVVHIIDVGFSRHRKDDRAPEEDCDPLSDYGRILCLAQ